MKPPSQNGPDGKNGHSPDAERAVLGAILAAPLDAERFGVFDALQPEDFTSPTLRQAFAAALTLSRNREPIDVLTVNALSHVPRSTLAETTLDVTSAAHVRHHAGIVRAASMRRAAAAIFSAAQAEDDPVTYAIRELQAVADRSPAHQTINLAQAEPTLIDRISNRERMSLGIQTGFHELDRSLGGLRDGELIIIAAQTGMGKSLLAANICERIGTPSYFFSMEMSAEMIYRRYLFAKSGVHKNNALTGYTTDQEVLSIREAHAALAIGQWYINDGPRLTPERLHSLIRQFQHKHGHCLVVVDYLQLMSAEGQSRYEVVSNISRELKLIAKDLKVPLIALSQLSRNATDRREQNKRDDIKIPVLSDLRDSGSIEQDADVVIFLARDFRYPKTHVVIAKNRNDAVGHVTLEFSSGPRFTDSCDTFPAGDRNT